MYSSTLLTSSSVASSPAITVISSASSFLNISSSKAKTLVSLSLFDATIVLLVIAIKSPVLTSTPLNIVSLIAYVRDPDCTLALAVFISSILVSISVSGLNILIAAIPSCIDFVSITWISRSLNMSLA